MREYELKKNHLPDLEKVMRECFGSAQKEGNRIIVSFGALKKLTAYIEKNRLYVDTEMDKSVGGDTAEQTVKRYNRFLELATGYTAKQRIAALRKKALKGKL